MSKEPNFHCKPDSVVNDDSCDSLDGVLKNRNKYKVVCYCPTVGADENYKEVTCAVKEEYSIDSAVKMKRLILSRRNFKDIPEKKLLDDFLVTHYGIIERKDPNDKI